MCRRRPKPRRFRQYRPLASRVAGVTAGIESQDLLHTAPGALPPHPPQPTRHLCHQEAVRFDTSNAAKASPRRTDTQTLSTTTERTVLEG